jgi:hypothetical protein
MATSRTTSSAYDPVHDPDDEAGYGLHGIIQSRQGGAGAQSQSSSDTQMQSASANQPRQQDGSYGYDSTTFSNVMQTQQDNNQGYLDILDPFNGFDIPFWFEQDQHWDVFQNFS